MNTDIRLSVSFKNHRKRKRLRRLLGDSSDTYLINLWLSVATDAPNGTLMGWDEEDIADACDWTGKPQKLIDCLINANFIDKDSNGEYVVHDWCTHQSWACKAPERSEIARKAANARWEKRYGKHTESMPEACGEHAESNAPSLSSPNQPYLTEPNDSIGETPQTPKPKRKQFVKPSVEEIKAYCDERKNTVDPENFFDHYEGNGWMRGKNKIKDWKACVRTWEKNQKPNPLPFQKQSGKSNFSSVLDRKFQEIKKEAEGDRPKNIDYGA